MQIQLPGVTLEAEYLPPPEQKVENNKLAVCLHPWSWLGGRMHDPVLLMLTEPLQAKNYHIIRYNSRGVGSSTGWPSFTGLKEGEDLAALIDWAVQHLNIPDIRTVTIIGYSHGSLIASLCPALPSPIKTSYILISYPLGVRGWLTMFRTSSYAAKLKELINRHNANVLVLFGDQDEFTAKESYESWAASLLSEEGAAEHLRVERRDAQGIMPLPDERPRASVANLIGRFEQQNKRQSLTATVPSRSSSVTSNNTGDSAKEEIKEKREWPPKPAADALPPPHIAAAAFWVKPKPSTSPPVNSVVLPSINLSDLSARADQPSNPAVTDKPADEQAKEDSVAGSAASNTPKPGSTPTPRNHPPADTQQSAKSAAPSSFRSPSKITATKSAPKSSLGSTTSTPLRPQHTGQSITSNSSSTRKPTVPKTAPSTPSRPKTPRVSATGAARPKTPSSASRPKTPSSGSVRPKTPSSGLFAPTAASLARSRNAPPPAPTPTRKATLSGAAADRLSKPTAASLSKARSPAAVPTRGTPATRGAATRGGKPKAAAGSATASKVKKAPTTKSGPVSAEEGPGEEVVHNTNGHEDLDIHAESGGNEPHEDELHEQLTSDPVTEPEFIHHDEQEHSDAEHVLSDAHESDSVSGLPSSPSPPSHELAPSPLPDESELPGDSTPVADKFSLSATEESERDHEVEQKSHIEVEESHAEVGNDIEDMVNLLEQPKARPISIVSVPDEVNEIPDEE